VKSIRARAPQASSALVRRVMQANRSRGTRPELVLQLALRRAGLRFQTDVAPEPALRCKADFVFRKVRVCVFVDGCYWHGCPRHFALPKTNAAWWLEKIADNQRRDRQKRAQLRKLGWTVIRVWECALTPQRTRRTSARIVRAIELFAASSTEC
jgi:DNA mismatch endonuclease (patch repair protein)